MDRWRRHRTETAVGLTAHPGRAGSGTSGSSVAYPSAGEIDALIRAIPFGETRTVKDLRADVAEAHGALTACPVTTGLHLRGIAEAVQACLAMGEPAEHVTPVWRVLDESSPLLARIAVPGAPLSVRRRMEAGERRAAR